MMKLDFSSLNVLYALGLFLAIGGCNSVFLVEGNLMYISAVVYLVGQVLVWLSGMSVFHKMLAFLLPAVIFVSIYSITNDNRVKEPAIWLIPEGYSGPLYVFLEEDCGQEEKLENDYRMYSPDREGRMFSRFSANPGLVVVPSKFFYTDGNGYRVHLQNLTELQDTSGFNPVWRDSTGQPIFAYQGESIKGRIGETKIVLEYAFVGTYRDYLEFVRTSPLPDSLPAALSPMVERYRATCE